MRTGQLLLICTRRLDAEREAEVVEVHGPNGGPPFLIRWLDTRRTELLFPDDDVWTIPEPRAGGSGLSGNRSG